MSDTPLADQVHVAYRLPSPQDAAALRLAALRESVIPKPLWDELAFFGHRQSLNVVALTPAANAFAELSPDFCLWLAQRLGAHVPMHLNEEPVTAALSSRPYDYSLHSFVLSRSGTDWKKAQEPERVIAALARRLHSDLTTFANAWGLKDFEERLRFSPPAVVSVRKTLPVSVPVATSEVPASFLVAKGVLLRWEIALGGKWAIGRMRGAGLGRLAYYAEPVSVTQWQETLKTHGMMMTIEEQMEALA